MAYKVFAEVGKGKNRSTSGSIPLPNKERVSNYVKRNPMIRSNTKIRVTNTKTGKVITGTRGRFIKYSFGKKYRF